MTPEVRTHRKRLRRRYYIWPTGQPDVLFLGPFRTKQEAREMLTRQKRALRNARTV